MIAHETGVTSTIDPLGGSYFVEALTDEMEAAAYDYFRRIDELGGMVAAVKSNFCQREIADASYELQGRIDKSDDPALERKQIARVGAVRQARDSAAVEIVLGQLRTVAATDENLMPSLVACARAHATEGEIVDALQDVWGTYTETPVF